MIALIIPLLPRHLTCYRAYMYNFKQVVTQSTHRRGHILDCVIIRPNDQVHLSSEVTDSLESDHLCVISCFDVSVARSCPVYRYVRNIRGIDRSAFVADLETELVCIGHSLSAYQYNVTLLSVLDKHAPAAKSRVTERMSSPWFGLVREDLLEAKRIRRQAERKCRNTNLTVFKDLYKKAKHHVTKVVLKAKKLYYNSKISSANCSKELYKITNNILARTKQVHLPTMYPLSSLPEMFSNYFSDKIMIIRNELDSQSVSALPAQTDSFSGITLSTFEPVTEVMVKHVIMKSAPKTCYLDPIPTPLLLEILDCLLPSLTALINSSLSSGLFPQVFKSAVIFPLLKKPSLDPNELKNFRPISNLPFISKIIEKLVLVQMSHHLSANNLLNQFQSAYRPGHSTETSLLKIVNDLLLSLDDEKISLLASLDLSAAFDTIDHNILLHRLQHDFGLSGTVLDWFSSYLSGRIQSVSVHSHTSVPVSVSCGVPQGSVLGPILFVLYTTPLSAVIERHSILHHSYADDSQHQNSATPDRLPDLIDSMRLCIDDIKDWMTDNKLKLNDDKTEVMIISSSRMSTALSIPESFDIGNASVPFSDTVKNLGVTLECHLSLKTHVLNVVRTANFELRRISSIRRLLTTEATATLVSAFILSRFDYCNSLLSGCPRSLILRLQKVQNNAARLILGISKREHISPHLASLHWLPIDSRIKYKLACICYNCMSTNSPPYLSDLLTVYTAARQLRSSTDNSVLRRPSVRTVSYGQRAFSYSAPSAWNSLPQQVRSSDKVSTFRSRTKTHLFRLAY